MSQRKNQTKREGSVDTSQIEYKRQDEEENGSSVGDVNVGKSIAQQRYINDRRGQVCTRICNLFQHLQAMQSISTP